MRFTLLESAGAGDHGSFKEIQIDVTDGRSSGRSIAAVRTVEVEDPVATVCIVEIELVSNIPATQHDLMPASHESEVVAHIEGDVVVDDGKRVRIATDVESVGFGAGVHKEANWLDLIDSDA